MNTTTHHSSLTGLIFATTLILAALAMPTQAPAQQQEPSPFRSFEDFTVERIRPENIPDYRPGLPQGSSRQSIADLPRALSGEQMRRVAQIAATTTVRIIAVHTPPKPYRPIPLIYHGHALWTSPATDGSDPVLLSTAHWLQDADAIYLFEPEQPRQPLSDQDIHLSPTLNVPFHQHTVENQNFLKDHEKDLTLLSIERSDAHFNLAILTNHTREELSPPKKGLILHNMDYSMPATIFGFTPTLGTTLFPISYIHHPLEDSLSFYFLTDFTAILAAPILSADGELLAISALRHPENAAWSLAIPPGAIHAFLGTPMAKGSQEEAQND